MPSTTSSNEKPKVVLTDEQQAAVDMMCTGVIGAITGGAGCHRAGQLIRRADGTCVSVEDVQPGERLAGFDGQVRTVLQLNQGHGPMARIVPVKGEPWVVNQDHILTVVASVSGEVTDLSVLEYLSRSKKFQTESKLLRQPYDYEIENVLRTGFKVELLSEDEDFYGFTLDGDGRYLLEDFTVTHNTGKTTALLTALQQTPEDVVDVALVAPTGKAAKRMNEVTGRPASTIHRLLKFRPGGMPKYHAYNKLPYSVIIVDEASMVDTLLAAKLLEAIDTSRTRVFFVGDANQLPSVAPGQVFDDLIQSGTIPVVRLTEVHRSVRDSWVCTNAPKVLKGKISLEKAPDFEFIEAKSVQTLPEIVADLAVNMTRNEIDHQILTAQNKGRIGVIGLNEEIQAALGRSGPSMASYFGGLGHEHRQYVGDKVIQMKNNYDLNVFNGEVGRVDNISGKEMTVSFADGGARIFKTADVWSLGLAYVISVHRSQGSEFDHVVVVCHHEHSNWSRSLLYTAITRAKKRVTVVGSREGVENALYNTSGRYRDTYLKARLEDLAGGAV